MIGDEDQLARRKGTGPVRRWCRAGELPPAPLSLLLLRPETTNSDRSAALNLSWQVQQA